MPLSRSSMFQVSAGCFLLVVLGCNQHQAPQAKLSGQVLFKGKPVSGGNITFYPETGPNKGGPISIPITNKGTYHVAIPFTGQATVTVTGKRAPDKTKLAQKEGLLDPEAQKIVEEKQKLLSSEQKQKWEKYLKPTPSGPPIPEKYGTPKTSPLRITIKGGEQVEDIRLVD
jgi:hypothetical protein